MAILKHLIRDLAGIIVPQYLKEDGSDFEAVKGANGALNVNATINGSLANIKSIGIDVGVTPVELTTGLMLDKTQLIIYPPTAGLIYWGSTDVDLATNGAPLNAGDIPIEFSFAIAGGFPIYAIWDGTTRNVRVVESK